MKYQNFVLEIVNILVNQSKNYSPPFLDFPESCYNEKDKINNLQDVYNNYVYISQNKIGDKDECSKNINGFDNF